MPESIAHIQRFLRSVVDSHFNVMDLSRYMTALMKLFQHFYYGQIGKKCLILLHGEISQR